MVNSEKTNGYFVIFVGIMFSFMKKDKTEKKEKKERKEGKLKSIKESGAGSSSSSSSSSNRKLTADELLRLDEVRRSLKIRTRRKDKEKLPSGITADYTANFNLATDDHQPPSSNSETSLNSLSKDASASSFLCKTSPPLLSTSPSAFPSPRLPITSTDLPEAAFLCPQAKTHDELHRYKISSPFTFLLIPFFRFLRP